MAASWLLSRWRRRTVQFGGSHHRHRPASARDRMRRIIDALEEMRQKKEDGGRRTTDDRRWTTVLPIAMRAFTVQLSTAVRRLWSASLP
jgi:hypothetical protein